MITHFFISQWKKQTKSETGNLLHYFYHKNSYKLIGINLSQLKKKHKKTKTKQNKTNTNILQQINFAKN